MSFDYVDSFLCVLCQRAQAATQALGRQAGKQGRMAGRLNGQMICSFIAIILSKYVFPRPFLSS